MQGFFSKDMIFMQLGQLQKLAKHFDALADLVYQFEIENKAGDKTILNVHFHRDEFTHITGLDHLPSIKRRGSNRSRFKSQIFNDILSNSFNESNLTSADNQALANPVSSYSNPNTNSPYTIEDRVNILSGLKNYLSSPDKMRIHKNWYSVNTKIHADYAISMPSNNPKERIFLFGYQTASSQSNSIKSIDINIFSAFADLDVLTRGKSKPYRVNEGYIIDKNKQVTHFYSRSGSAINTSPTVVKFQLPSNEPTLAVAGLGAIAAKSKEVEVRISPMPPFKSLLQSIIKAFKSGIKKLYTLISPKQPTTPLSNNDTAHKSIRPRPNEVASDKQEKEEPKQHKRDVRGAIKKKSYEISQRPHEQAQLSKSKDKNSQSR